MAAPVHEPLSWLLVQLVRGLIGDITPDNGYYNDFSGTSAVRLLDDRTQIAAADGPYVLVIATDFTPTAEATGRTRTAISEDVSLLIEYGIARPEIDPDNPSAPPANVELLVHRARWDILRVLRTPLRGQPYGICSIEIEGSSISDAPDDAPLIIGQVTARAGLTESLPPAS